MRLTRKQQEEIDALTSLFCTRTPTEEEIQSYIAFDAAGIGSKADLMSSWNSLYWAKRGLNIAVDMWREDLTSLPHPLLFPFELLEDREFAKFPYMQRVIQNVLNDTMEARHAVYTSLPCVAVHRERLVFKGILKPRKLPFWKVLLAYLKSLFLILTPRRRNAC